jgi:hypothetical protein
MAASTEQTAKTADIGEVRLDSTGFVTLAVAEHEDRLHVTLHRPDTRNAIDRAMVDELHTTCAHLEANPNFDRLGHARGPGDRRNGDLRLGRRHRAAAKAAP